MEAQHSLWPLSDNFLFYFQICRRRSLETPSPADCRALLGLRSCNSEGCPTFRCAVEKLDSWKYRLTYLRADSVFSTGNFSIITSDHMMKMMNNAIVRNIGHFDKEIDLASVEDKEGMKVVNIKPQKIVSSPRLVAARIQCF